MSPNLSAMSQTGSLWPIIPATCRTGSSFTSVTVKGKTSCACPCTTAWTSGQGRKDAGMDDALGIERIIGFLDRFAITVEDQNIFRSDLFRAARSRQEKVVRVVGEPHADMAVAVDDTFVRGECGWR